MDGQNLSAGAVAGVDGVANPVQLARLVMTKMDASEAADAAIEYLRRRVNGRGGLIMIDNEGRCASRFTTRKMIHAWIEHAGETMLSF